MIFKAVKHEKEKLPQNFAAVFCINTITPGKTLLSLDERMEIIMTEYEKMIAGDWYNANHDKGIVEKIRNTEQLCWYFNQARPGSDEQMLALQEILGCEIPAGLKILAPVYFDYGDRTSFGKRTFVNHGCYFMDGGLIEIGENNFIGPFCGFYTAQHPHQIAERNIGLERALPIKVGDNCWFGGNVTVLPGVTIGNGCVIAAGSLVKTDLPDNCVAAGVPAVVKKNIETAK